MTRLSRVVSKVLAFVILSSLVASAQGGVVHVDFDNLSSGTRTGTHYLAEGVMFFDSNGSRGTSTAIRVENGEPVTAMVANFGTSISLPNVLVPGSASNNDIWVQFYRPNGNRTTADFLQVQNDAEGFPTIALEAYDRQGVLIERTGLVGSQQFVSITHPDIYFAKFVSNPSTPGNIGVDNFSFSLTSTVPEPTTGVLLGSVAVCGFAEWLRRRRAGG